MEVQNGKCDEKSKQFAVEGDELLAQSKCLDALAAYNKSLCLAQPKSVQLSIVLQKRSAVYFQLKRYQKCLESIQLSRKILNLSTNDSTFTHLEESCLENISSKEEDEDEEKNDYDPWKFFKLSYSPHDKIPFIVDCLKPTETWKYGRMVITTRDLKAGDVVAIEEPLFKMLNKDSRYTRCANCLRFNLMNLIPCPGKCTRTMFCSSWCLKSALLGYHKFECGALDTSLDNDNEYDMMIFKDVLEALNLCGSLEKLQAAMRGLKPSLSLFDFDLKSATTNEEREEMRLKAICALKKGPTSKEDVVMADWIVESHPALSSAYKNSAQKDFLKSFVIKVMGITDRNSYILSCTSLRAPHVDEEIGSGVFPFSSLINHSCSPNLYRLFVDNKQVFVVKKPIEAGQQLFVGYQSNFTISPRKERQEFLMKDFQFKCTCEACTGDFPLMQHLKKCDKKFQEPPTEVEKVSDAIRHFNNNCRYIDLNIKHLPFPCYEIFSVMQNSFKHLQFIVAKGLLFEQKMTKNYVESIRK